jgi:hypothetical protein
MQSQIQHGWTQVQIPYGWTLKFNMNEFKLSIMQSQIQHGWTQVQIQHGVNSNSQYYVLTNWTWVNLSSNSIWVWTLTYAPHWWPKKCASLYEISVVNVAFNATHLSKMEHHDISTRVSNCRGLDFLLVSHQGLFFVLKCSLLWMGWLYCFCCTTWSVF